MQQTKKQSRLKRARRFRARNRILDLPRLSVFRTPKHIYAQIIEFNADQARVITSASTLEKEIRTELSGDKSEKAKLIGGAIAKRAKQAGIEKVAFDRSGFKYHGRIKALADSARENGLVF